MEPIFAYCRAALGTVNATALLTLFSVTPLGRWSPALWQEALTALAGHRVVCESYRDVGRWLRFLAHFDKPAPPL